MSSTTPSLKATDLLAVKSRVSWGAIAAGAMVALSVYLLLSFIGLAVGLEVSRRPRMAESVPLGLGTTIYVIVSLLLSMFLGGWATSRLAVGESKLEAVLYGIILWGVLFVGMFWLIGSGFSAGFGAIMNAASGAVVVVDDDPSAAADEGAAKRLVDRYSSDVGGDKFVEDLTKMGVDNEQAKKIQTTLKERIDTLRNNPTSLPEQVKGDLNDPAIRRAGDQLADASRQAAWYSLAGIVLSMISVILGSLIGSGDLPVPVPVLGVRRSTRVDPRL
ncbi:hypothetical protein TA3x_005372 [Tundrisphaera sp. TA3]|uniref:hypothetical protein n=1 Tax=Tundrisphaera sp. TA3 TaxID=3435775 RepID=UPI003EBAEEDD